MFDGAELLDLPDLVAESAMSGERRLGKKCNYRLSQSLAKLPRDKIFVMFGASHS